MEINLDAGSEGNREFYLLMLEHLPDGMFAPAGQPELATRDMPAIDRWRASDQKLQFGRAEDFAAMKK